MIKDIKFYIGPMSKNIVDSIIEFCNNDDYNIGLIPSRRQIEYDNSGYVNGWNTKSFVDYVKGKTDKVLVCRDHGGIGQGKNYDNGTLSFYNDKYMDIIHIDPWKKYHEFDDVVNETVDNIKFLYSLNNKCKFEVGTEELIFPYDGKMLDLFLNKLQDKLGNIYENVVYGVIQSGTGLLGTKNIGIFNSEKCGSMVNICHKNGILSKEHNGDYLSNDDIKTRFDLGLDAINIAPEDGVFETKVILDNINDEQLNILFDICEKSNKWVKWVDEKFIPEDNKKLLVEICGHYLFNNNEFNKIKYDIPNIDNIIKSKLINKLKNIKNI